METKQHFAVLDGLRGVAALVVLSFHVLQSHQGSLPEAALAVDFFFVLSGFVVAYAYETKLQNGMTVEAFMLIRLKRLYPLIFFGVSVGVTLTVLHALLLQDLTVAQLIWGAALAYAVLPTFETFPQWATAYPMNLPAWSLFFELAINLVYAVIAAHLTTKRLVIVTIGSAVTLIATSAYVGGLQGLGSQKAGFFLGFVRVTFPFFAGVLLFRLKAVPRPAPVMAGLLLCAVVALLLAPLPQSSLVDLAYVLFTFPAIIHVGALVTVTGKLARACLLLGQLSYPVYIVHQPFLRLFYWANEKLHINPVFFGVMEVVGCVLIAYGALRFFDEPVRAWLTRRPTLARGAVVPPVAVSG